MQKEGLVVYQKRCRKYSSYKGELSPEVENLHKQDFSLNTQTPSGSLWSPSFLYQLEMFLSPVIDWFDSNVTAWTLGGFSDAALVNEEKAIELLRENEESIIHSDRGCHYRWPCWIERTKRAGLINSMSIKGCPPDNSACEGFLGRLKNEMFYCCSCEGTIIEDFFEKVN